MPSMLRFALSVLFCSVVTLSACTQGNDRASQDMEPNVDLVDGSVTSQAQALSPAQFASVTTGTASVAIHVSEATDAGWSTLATQPIPSDSYFHLAHASWKFWHIHGLLMEQLASDGTPFVVVSDADVAAGRLVIGDADIAEDIAAGRSARRRGSPKFAAVFSLSNTCGADAVAAGLDGFVLAGGHAIVGGTTFTRTGACGFRSLPPYVPGATSGRAVHATAENSFPGYPASAAVGNTCTTGGMWINEISDRLPSWWNLRFETPGGGLPTIAQVGIIHSNYEERGFGYSYRIKDYDVQVSSDPACAVGSFVTVATGRGNDINREYQVVSFAPRSAKCVRIVARSSYETRPYPGYDVTQWVGLSSVQVFDSNGNSLVRNACLGSNPWRPLGLTRIAMDGCFDHARRRDPGLSDSLLSHFERDDKVRGFRLGTNKDTSGFEQRHHWGQAVALATPSGETPATILVEEASSSQLTEAAECRSGHARPMFTKRARGRGRYIYHAAVSPLAGWSMHTAVSYVYGVYRHAVDEAHAATGLPNVRLGTFRWPYVAGFMTRHDHRTNFGFSASDPTLPTRIERYKDALTGGTTPRDFPVKGGYFLLSESGALPNGTGPCAQGAATCDANVRSTLLTMIANGAEIGTHAFSSETVGPSNLGFLDERARLTAYLGTLVNPPIYASHGAYAHFDGEGPYVSLQTMANAGIVAKGEDAFGAHPHFALKLSASRYDASARWNMVEIPATSYSTQPVDEPGQWPPFLGVISHEIASDPFQCNQDSTPARSCMQKAVDLVYSLGGIINVYDHIGHHLPHLANPTASQFAAYIDYAQNRRFVETTSTRELAAFWPQRATVRVGRVVTETVATRSVLLNLTGTSTTKLSVEVDLPSFSTPDPIVTVGGLIKPKCPALSSGAGLKAWLASSSVINGCYVREGARVRVPSSAPGLVTVTFARP